MALFDLVTATVGLVFLSSLVTADATAIRNYVDTIKKMIEDSTRQGSGDDVFGLSNYASFGIALVPMLVAAMFMFFRVAKPFVRAKENRAERK